MTKARGEVGAQDGRRLLSVEEARARLLALAEPVDEVEPLPLEMGVERALAETVSARTTLPPFDCSVMDGYALRSAELAGDGPWRFTVIGRVAAGESGAGFDAAPAGSALRVLTGAPVPPSFDVVAMQEHVRCDGDRIRLDSRIPAGLNIRRAGEDARAGAALLSAGARLDPSGLAAAAAAGRAEILVRRRLRVAFFSTGGELRAPGGDLGPGQIYNSNRFALIAALAKPWVEPVDLGVAPDAPEAIASALRRGAERADLIVSTGGLAYGDEDHVLRCFQEVGGALQIFETATKPGKPIAAGRLGRAAYLGLPGTPVGALIGWRLFGAPLAMRLAGFSAEAIEAAAATWPVRAALDGERRPGRREFRPARIVGRGADGVPVAQPIDGRFMSRISSLAQADGLLVIPAETTRIRHGDLLFFLPF